MRENFIQAIKTHQTVFTLEIPDDKVEKLADLYDLILEHNSILHLVGPCTPEEFAVRHILESLTLLKYLPSDAKFADVGAGAGLPSIPCLIARPDLSAILIESKERKSEFLINAVKHLGLDERVEIAAKQFSEVSLDGCSAITCRALDKFIDRLPRMVKWAKLQRLLLFGGPSLGSALQELRIRHVQYLLPLSEQRYLFVSQK